MPAYEERHRRRILHDEANPEPPAEPVEPLGYDEDEAGDVNEDEDEQEFAGYRKGGRR